MNEQLSPWQSNRGNRLKYRIRDNKNVPKDEKRLEKAIFSFAKSQDLNHNDASIKKKSRKFLENNFICPQTTRITKKSFS